MKILESYSAIAKSLLLEDEDDRYVHIGYGKYKEKDSRTGEPLPNSPTYIKKDSGGFEMVDDDDPRLSKGDDKGGEEKPSGGGMGAGDFERDFDDSEPEDKPFGGDTGRDADSGGVEGPSPEDDDWDSESVMTAKLDGEEVGDIIDKGEEHPNYDKAMDYVLQFDPDAEKVISGPGRKKDEPEVDGPSSDEWGGDISKVMSAKIDGEEVGDVIGDEDHPNYEKAIIYLMQFDPDDEKVISGPGRKKDETVIINGKKYRPIKESKKHILKENYERFFGKNTLNEYSLSDSDNLWDSNGVEDRQVIMKALKKDKKIMKKIGPDPYWDDIDLVADNDDGDTVATLRRNMTLKALKQAILKWRGQNFRRYKMKQLIVDYLPFEILPEQISESMKENGGKLIVRGVLQRADTKNQNGRVYPKEILMREAKKYFQNFIHQKRAMGELDHPESSVVNLANVSHNITEMTWNGDDLVGTVEVLGTPSGNILKELFKSGIKLGISSRGMGTVETMTEADGDSQEVQDDFELIAFDFVSNPSTHGAFMHPMHESVDHSIVRDTKYGKVEAVINDILRGQIVVKLKDLLKEYIDLSTPIKDVKGHFKQFEKDMDYKRGGSFDADSGEYHGFEGGDDKLYAKRHKQLSAWEKKVKKTLDGLMKDYEKAWK